MVFRLYVLPRFGAVALDAITQREVRAWVTSLTVRGLAPATVHKAYQLFAKTMTAAVDGGMLGQTPCRGVPLPKVEHEEMRYLNPAEIACLAEAIRPGYQALVFVGAYGGLRIGELAGLRRSRVDLDAGTVDVAETVVEVEGRLLFGPPKTRAGRRRIGLPRRVVDELALHLRAPGRPTDPVFRSPAGGPLRVTGFRNRIWRPATLAAGLPGLRIHDLRHTAVALWIAAGASPKGGRGPGRAHLDQLRPGPLRPPVPRVRCGAPRPLGRAVCAHDGTTTEHDRLETRPGRRNRIAPCALSRCEVGVEVRGFEPLASSVRETIRVIGGPGRMLEDAR